MNLRVGCDKNLNIQSMHRETEAGLWRAEVEEDDRMYKNQKGKVPCHPGMSQRKKVRDGA